MRPATASFVIGGSAWWPSSSRLDVAEAEPQLPRVAQVLRHVVVEDLERTLDPGARRDGSLCERRRLASSKFTSRFAVARTSRRWRSSSHAATLVSRP